MAIGLLRRTPESLKQIRISCHVSISVKASGCCLTDRDRSVTTELYQFNVGDGIHVLGAVIDAPSAGYGLEEIAGGIALKHEGV